MAYNLRDKGYPQSRTERINRSDKRNALMTNDLGAFPYAGKAELGTEPVQSKDLLGRLVNAYNNRAYGNPNAPLAARYGVDYVDDNRDERAYRSGVNLYSRNGNRLGFIDRDVTTSNTNYNAGIDNLTPILGDRYFDKEINTPFGSAYMEYDGDTLAGNIDVPSNAYYLVALKNLLSRGSL